MPGIGSVRRVGPVMDHLARLAVPGSLNLYDEDQSVAWGDRPGQATARARALRRYLRTHWSATTLLVGEAPGRNGARQTGVPFTSPRQLTGVGPDELSARSVHRALAELHASDRVLLWNVSMLFPPDNRDPRSCEVAACAEVLALVSRGRRVLAVGRHAARATGAPYLRHPSHGGGPRFLDGLRAALADDGH
jgi:hypothetical protein